MATNFRAVRKFLGPSWLTSTGDGELLGWTLDVLKDAFTQRLFEGLLARFPQQDPTGTPAPDDALAAMGRDRRVIRGINEPSATYAKRLLLWLDDWKQAGNPFGLLKQLAAYCGPLPSFRTVDVRGNWFTLNADGTQEALINEANWDWDGDPYALFKWSRFWVIIYPNGLWVPGTKWGDVGAVYGTPGRTWGSTATSDQVASIKSIIAERKPAGTRCVNIILAFDNSTFSPTALRDGTGLPDGHWGHWSKVSGAEYVPARLSTARFWDGV